MTTLTVVPSVRAVGVNLAGVAANAGGDAFPNTGAEVIVIKNGSGSPITLTVVTPALVDGLAVTDLAVVIGAGETRMVGPFPSGTYADPTTGAVSLTYSAVTTVNITIVKVAL
jgi:hypothetical protein